MSTVEAEPIEGEVVEVDNTSSIAVLNSSEIDTQITTAKKFPRSITEFKRRAEEMVALDEETAGTMFYVLPRDGKRIDGPSIRLAEVAGCCYKNLRYGARIVDVGDRFLVAQGMCHDLENNIAIALEVRRRITRRDGSRYGDDMIQVTGNAAVSIALRDAILRVIPRALVKPLEDLAKKTSIGKAMSVANQRIKGIEWFTKLGATQEQVLAALGRKGIDDLTVDDLITLRGLANSIKDGQTSLEQALQPEGEPAKVKASPLNQQQPAAERSGNGSSKAKSQGNPSAAADSPPPTTEPSGNPSGPVKLTDADKEAYLGTIGNLSDMDDLKAAEDRQLDVTEAEPDRKWVADMTEQRRQQVRGKRGGRSNGPSQQQMI